MWIFRNKMSQHGNIKPHQMGLPAHKTVFIFFTILTGIFKSSFFKEFENAIFIFNKFWEWLSSFFRTKEIWVLHIFNLQWRVKEVFIFLFKQNLPPSMPGQLYYKIFMLNYANGSPSPTLILAGNIYLFTKTILTGVWPWRRPVLRQCHWWSFLTQIFFQISLINSIQWAVQQLNSHNITVHSSVPPW